MLDVSSRLSIRGFDIVPGVLDAPEVNTLLQAIEAEATLPRGAGRGGVRNLMDRVPELRELARSSPVRKLVEAVLGPAAMVVRGILFDKRPEANWKVPWHQDLSIAVQAKADVPGFGPWSIKEGVHHVQAPAAILEKMLSVRIHLDDCAEENGPLRVIPGTHTMGRLSANEIQTLQDRQGCSCTVGAGGVLLMRPLLLHASSASQSPSHRRVIHLEFAAGKLPEGLAWYAEAAS